MQCASIWLFAFGSHLITEFTSVLCLCNQLQFIYFKNYLACMRVHQALSSYEHGASMQANKPPKVNWPHHENAVQGYSSRDDFLSSSFLFSLPAQRPNPEARERMLSLRYASDLWKPTSVRHLPRQHESLKRFSFAGLLPVKFKAQSVFRLRWSRRYDCDAVTCYEYIRWCLAHLSRLTWWY